MNDSRTAGNDVDLGLNGGWVPPRLLRIQHRLARLISPIRWSGSARQWGRRGLCCLRRSNTWRHGHPGRPRSSRASPGSGSAAQPLTASHAARQRQKQTSRNQRGRFHKPSHRPGDHKNQNGVSQPLDTDPIVGVRGAEQSPIPARTDRLPPARSRPCRKNVIQEIYRLGWKWIHRIAGHTQEFSSPC